MLSLKDLQNRVYSGRECVEFSYDVVDISRAPNDKERNCFRAIWRKGEEYNEWHMRVIIDRTRDADSQVYNFGYIMPRSGLPLELIAATGLRYFQMYIQQEVQMKSNWDFVLGDILRGM